MGADLDSILIQDHHRHHHHHHHPQPSPSQPAYYNPTSSTSIPPSLPSVAQLLSTTPSSSASMAAEHKSDPWCNAFPPPAAKRYDSHSAPTPAPTQDLSPKNLTRPLPLPPPSSSSSSSALSASPSLPTSWTAVNHHHHHQSSAPSLFHLPGSTISPSTTQDGEPQFHRHSLPQPFLPSSSDPCQDLLLPTCNSSSSINTANPKSNAPPRRRARSASWAEPPKTTKSLETLSVPPGSKAGSFPNTPPSPVPSPVLFDALGQPHQHRPTITPTDRLHRSTKSRPPSVDLGLAKSHLPSFPRLPILSAEDSRLLDNESGTDMPPPPSHGASNGSHPVALSFADTIPPSAASAASAASTRREHMSRHCLRCGAEWVFSFPQLDNESRQAKTLSDLENGTEVLQMQIRKWGQQSQSDYQNWASHHQVVPDDESAPGTCTPSVAERTDSSSGNSKRKPENFLADVQVPPKQRRLNFDSSPPPKLCETTPPPDYYQIRLITGETYNTKSESMARIMHCERAPAAYERPPNNEHNMWLDPNGSRTSQATPANEKPANVAPKDSKDQSGA